MDNKYFGFHYSLLKCFGLNLFTNPKEKPNYFYAFYSIIQLGVWVFLFTITLVIAIPYIYKDLDSLMLNLSFSITFTLSFIKLYVVVFNKDTIQEIIEHIEITLCEFSQNKKIMKRTVRISKQLTISVLIFANMTVIGLIIGGTIKAVASPKIHSALHNSTFLPSNRILPMPVFLPFEINSDFAYSIAFVYQILGISIYGNIVVLINTFMITVMVHIGGRFANLRYVLENLRSLSILKLIEGNRKLEMSKDKMLNKYFKIDGIEERAMIIEKSWNGKFSEENLNKVMLKCLKECIEHHISIILCAEKFEKVYNIGFLTHVINNLNIICHVMIQIYVNDFFSIRFGTAIALFFTVVSELLLQCYSGNELTLQAIGVGDSAYNCNWYSTDKHFKKLLIILIARSQKSVKVTAGKFAPISNSTFVTIMRGAYSFFAVIRTVKDN